MGGSHKTAPRKAKDSKSTRSTRPSGTESTKDSSRSSRAQASMSTSAASQVCLPNSLCAPTRHPFTRIPTPRGRPPRHKPPLCPTTIRTKPSIITAISPAIHSTPRPTPASTPTAAIPTATPTRTLQRCKATTFLVWARAFDHDHDDEDDRNEGRASLISTTGMFLPLVPRPRGVAGALAVPEDNNDTISSLDPVDTEGSVLEALTKRATDPANLGWINKWAAVGDSYTAGIGSGVPLGKTGVLRLSSYSLNAHTNYGCRPPPTSSLSSAAGSPSRLLLKSGMLCS
ncbi:uncharacterized protein B0I36DRAFT_431744 [Microdochium trichocladiopsis]|uniref:SGNH hydrolase-type esterase domain-containing protein n=1 Tax=Microdochium trichocladiopsis TaxID=1682393 RepID=A0A9P8Y1J9_9PEZI|nr:uncharacterized protein B0I36DRAFT_431744 [Microdochium trichocladiopsis]KAH7028739.1 hypothetical protein B0I36DRAFT_431744 [Microdochium trichocladiopsis]